MEATGVYRKPVYYGLEALVPEVVGQCDPRQAVPGRKTDLSDAEWLADVAAHGMGRPNFVPSPPIRELRELTRYRKTQIDARVKEILYRTRGGSAPAGPTDVRRPVPPCSRPCPAVRG